MACVEVGDDQVEAKNTEPDGPTPRGEGLLVWGYEFSSSLTSQEHPPASLLVGDLWCYISLLLVHPLPTLVSHPCQYLSARLISHSFWRSVSCCGPDSTVQGSRPHKWGQGISCGYLIRRWQLLLELLFYHAPTAGPLSSELPLGCSRGLPLAVWHFPLPWFWSAKDRVVIGSISWQFRFLLIVLEHFILLDMGHGPDMKWVGVPRSFGPTNTIIVLNLNLKLIKL